jgi:hypothetical protein
VAWKGDNFEIAGITRDMIDRFSLRTNQINQAAEQRGITDPRDKDKLGALTRERKHKDATMPGLRAEWRQRVRPVNRIFSRSGFAPMMERRVFPSRRGDHGESAAAGGGMGGVDRRMARQRPEPAGVL